jgi:ferrous iron transport protein A
MNIPLINLPPGQRALIVAIHGGLGFQRRLRTMGIREGKTIGLVVCQPFRGPLVVEIDGKHLTLGKGMARHIVVRWGV